MIDRYLASYFRLMMSKYPVIALTGPRQSGKTTLVKHLCPNLPYITLEDPDTRLFAASDPRSFLNRYPDGAIFDEIQQTPELFSYIQSIVDNQRKNGMYILTGSQNFMLHEKISQTLAGRTALLKLLPLTISEIKAVNLLMGKYDDLIFNGFYPRLYDQQIAPADFYPFYIETYIQRDIRQVKNILNLSTFIRFIKLCSARIGQLLNLSSLANDCGIAVSTAQQWISLLETCYIVYLLKPHYANYNKRLVKMPKLYFYDTGLACSLLNIENPTQLSNHYLKGGLFENMVIVDYLKQRLNQGLPDNCYFWRDKTGNEIDLMIEKGGGLFAIEIKSGETYNADYFKGIRYWNRISNSNPENAYVVYAGNQEQKFQFGNLLNVNNFLNLNL
jgi:uncharacterized protein